MAQLMTETILSRCDKTQERDRIICQGNEHQETTSSFLLAFVHDVMMKVVMNVETSSPMLSYSYH